MRTLTENEIESVSGGLYGGQCNDQLVSYALANIGLVSSVAGGPATFAVGVASWAYSVKSLNQCAGGYNAMMDNMIITQYMCGYC